MKYGTPGRRWPLRLLFILLVPCLLLQLKIRDDTEPFPAILLPSGASLLKTRGSYTRVETQCVAEDSAGRKYVFPVASLLSSVPTDYDLYVLKAGFGITKDRMVRHIPVPFLGHRLSVGRPKTAPQIAETRAWLRTRLREMLGINATRIHILSYGVTTYYNEIPVRQQRELQEDKVVELTGAGT
jgi:hypothetical protein